ncbi:MAG: peptidoglycan-binding protein [Porticoccaceae bacterium]
MESTKIKQRLLMRGNQGDAVFRLKKALRETLGEAALTYPGLAAGDVFDADTEAALREWQASSGLVADGVAGPRVQAALKVAPPARFSVSLNIATVSALFPFTKPANIASNLPYVTAALAAFGLTDPVMVATALGTVRAETEGFVPIAELPSRFNTLPGLPPFSAYECGTKVAQDLGNKEPGDGRRFCGRGYVQLTGRDNYLRYGAVLDIPLADNPDWACAPEIAACLLAAFLHENKDKLAKALAKADLRAARKVVNGGSHGLDRFTDTFTKAQTIWAVPVPMAARVGGKRKAPAVPSRAKLDVNQDPQDLRDRAYTPPPRSLPQVFPGDADIARFLGAYTRAKLILDQGKEGACAGFGLACVINYLRWRAAGMPAAFARISPRMLYHFARRFDEYEGESYEGSSCRGALKGWYHNGVCGEAKWDYKPGVDNLPVAGWDAEAIETTLGVYYRIESKAITDLQAAIQEVGAIYVSANTHAGWDAVGGSAKAPAAHAALPVIEFDGGQPRGGGHAFALVGFNRVGFVIQNSWGQNWGAGGFAVIGYADWLANGMDAWVAALGVPGVVAGRFATGATAASRAAAAPADWWSEETAYQHSIVLGNNGCVNHFDTVDGVNRTLHHQAAVLPDAWFRTSGHDRKRLVLYAHGGLNSEADAIKRARAMGRYFLANGCYPFFLVWKSGLFESIGNALADKAPGAAQRVRGIADALTDPLVEKTVGRYAARPLWSEMKENAELAADSGRGGDLLSDAFSALASSWGDRFELHLVGHSAGSIALGWLLANFARKDLVSYVKSVHLYAPACTVAFANRRYAPYPAIMDNLYLDILSDRREQEDSVAYIYHKSLLYLVSNALEADKRIPILGLANVFDAGYSGWDGSSTTGETLANWRNAREVHRLDKRLTLHDNDRYFSRRGANAQDKLDRAAHGGFDNNVEVIGKTLERITGAVLGLPVTDLVGF